MGFLQRIDFQIRHATKNRKSLDTAMQALYRKYYQQLKRGWTDGEFREVCESVAGIPVEEIFDYASTTRAIDYSKYLRYAGLELEKPVEQPQAYLGVIAEDLKGKLLLSAVEEDSPALRAGLAAGDGIKTLDNAPISAVAPNASIVNKKPGEKIKVVVTRAGRDFEADITLSHAMLRSYKIIPIANPDAMQSAILKDWIKARQSELQYIHPVFHFPSQILQRIADSVHQSGNLTIAVRTVLASNGDSICVPLRDMTVHKINGRIVISGDRRVCHRSPPELSYVKPVRPLSES